MVRCRHRQDLAISSDQKPHHTSFDGRSILPECSVRGSDAALRGGAAKGAPRRGGQFTIPGGLTTFLLAMLLPNLLLAQAQSSSSQTSSAQTSSTAQSSSASITQSTPANAPPTGWQGFAQVQYGANLIGTVLIFDADLGYGLTDHLSADIGVPVIFTRNPFSPVTTHDYYWSALLGEPYLDVKYTGIYHNIDYTSVLTGTVPAAGSAEDRIYSTGRFGVDWFNHLDEQVGSVTPFLNIEASNGAVNRFIMPRPFEEARMYQSLGLLGDAEAGFEYKVNTRFVRGVNIGASAYLQDGGGPQKMFSRLVFPYSSLAGDGNHDRYWDATFETKGISKVTEDNGWSVWLDTKPLPNLEVQLAYTRSVHYDMDIYTAVFNFDASQWIKPLFRRR